MARKTVHGRDYRSPTYRSFNSMKQRVRGTSGRVKKAYAGVKVCDRWLEPHGQGFLNFLADMGERPAGTSLDRIDGAGNYEPGNCRWATNKVQGSNRACVEQITYNGKTQNPEDWARELGLKPQTIRSRIKRGWPLERVLTAKAKRGTPGEMGRHKITEAIAREILATFRFYSKRRTNADELAAKYGVSRGIVYMVGTGRAWKHLQEQA